MKKVKLTSYKDGAMIRLHNRKIIVFADKEDGEKINMRFVKYDPAEGVPCIHSHIKGKIHKTDITLTREGAVGLLLCLQETLNNKSF